MAYDVNRVTKLGQLKLLAEKIKSDYATKASVTELENRIDDLVSTGGEPNVINGIKVNGVSQTITDKIVDIKMPTKVSEFTNDSNFQTGTQVSTAIQTAISESGHAHFEEVTQVPSPEIAKENVLYLVKNADTGYYDIYALVSGRVVRIDDTTVDLSNYVQKEDGKGLSSNDYTTAEKDKLANIENNANNYVHPTYTNADLGLYKLSVDEFGHVSVTVAADKADITALGIPGQDTTYEVATTSMNGLMSAIDKTKLDGLTPATDAEVGEMLNGVFTTA